MWWFDWPANPYVAFNGAVDFTEVKAYLAEINAGGETRVSVHHVLVAAIARTLAAFPNANARIIGHRLEHLSEVGVAMPVNLVGHDGGDKLETGLAVVEKAASLSLRQVARSTRKGVAAERGGVSSNRLLKSMYKLVDRTPYRVLARGLSTLNRASRFPPVARKLHTQLPLSTMVTNVGSELNGMEGALFRGGSMAPPIRIMHFGTIWGVAPVQDEVIAVDGQPTVRPMLPFILLFDHRLFDGVQAGKIVSHLVGLLKDPAATFGEDGSR